MLLLRRDVFGAKIASIFATFAQIIFIAYLGIHLTILGASVLIIGLVFGLRNIIQILFRIPIGEFSQVTGRKPLILTGMMFYAISFVYMYIATSWSTVAFATFLFGVGMSFYYPSLFAYIADIADGDYGKINGIVFQGSDISTIVGAFIINLLLDRGILSLAGVFSLSFVVGLFGVIIIALLLPETLKSEFKVIPVSKLSYLVDSFRGSIRSFKRMSKMPHLRVIYALQLIIAFGEFFLVSFFGLYIVLAAGYPFAEVAKIIAIGTLILFVFKPYLGSISDRFGFKIPVAFSLLASTVLLVALSYFTTMIQIIIIYAVLRSITMMSYLAINGATAYNSSERQRGVAMGTLGVYVSLGRTISSISLGLTWYYLERTGRELGDSLLLVFRLAAIIILIATGLVLLFSRNQSLAKIDNSEPVIPTLDFVSAK